MRDSKSSRPISRHDIVVGTISLLLVGAFYAFLFTNDYTGAQVVFSALLFNPICVCLHELGHAFAAIAVGGGVRYIQMGKRFRGTLPWRLRCLGFHWIVFPWPFAGIVFTDVYSVRFYRLRECVITAAGPAINLILLIVSITVLTTVDSGTFTTTCLGLIICNGFMLFYSLIPRDVTIGDYKGPNDSLLFLQTVRLKPDIIDRRVEYSQLVRQFRQDVDHYALLSLDELLAKYDGKPDDIALLWNLTLKLAQENDKRYPNFVLKLIEHPQLRKQDRRVLIDNYLTWQLIQGPPENPEFADKLSSELLADDRSLTTHGTRGCILVDLGKVEEGRKMLEEVLIKSTSAVDRVFCYAFLALANEHEGKTRDAVWNAEKARTIGAKWPVLKRVAHILDPTK